MISVKPLLFGGALLGLSACARQDETSHSTSTETKHMSYEVKDFTADVIERSRTTPVLVDFWAPWCGPCKTLKPTLEKLAGEAGDRWALVTVDVMNFEGTAAQFGIRSIPDVKLFSGGRVVAQFTGSMPESAVREWLDKNLPAKAPAQP